MNIFDKIVAIYFGISFAGFFACIILPNRELLISSGLLSLGILVFLIVKIGEKLWKKKNC